MRQISLITLLLSFLAAPAFAFDVKTAEEALDAKTLTVAALAPNFDQARVDAYLAGPVWTAWNEAHGNRWVAQYDTLTGHPRRVYGGAIPWIPGAANNLTGSATSADLERVARAFIAANGPVLGVGNANLTFNADAASPTRDGRMRYAIFDYHIDGVPVENGRLLFAVNNGNMIYWHSANIAAVPAVTTPALTAAQASSSVLAYAGLSATQIDVVEQPHLKLLPRNRGAGELITYQLVYQTAFRVHGGEGTWASYIDALTGTVIAFANANHYASEPSGKVTGGIRAAQATDPEVVRSFPFATIDSPSGARTSTFNGSFLYNGRTASTTLSGTFFDVSCVSCPVQTSASSSIGRIDLGIGGADHIGNGRSTPSERTAFFHTNVARLIALKWLDLPWLQSSVPVNVNIASTCNAFWNGTSLNFFRSGNGCANTGEIRDVMQHEWGHGIDDNDGDDPGYEAALGLGDMATGEAVGDHIALFVDHDSCIGQSFAAARNTGKYITDPATMQVATCNGVRDVDELRANRGVLTINNVTAVCPGPPVSTSNPFNTFYIGPMLRQGHCEGEIWGQTAYHLVQNLITGRSYGTVRLDANKQHATYTGDPILDSPVDGSKNPGYDRDVAWTIHERLFFESRPMVASYAPSRHQAMGPSAYDGYIVTDDTGDGLLPNGTPNAAYINDAFIHHGIEEAGISVPHGNLTAVDTKDCTAPATPAVTLTQQLDPTTGKPAVKISWTAVAGAASYTVLRNERRDDVFLEVARVTNETSVLDAGVDNGVAYHYRVQANAAGACFAVSSGGVQSITVAQPDAVTGNATVTDTPRGNGDGRLDAGERADLFLTIRNIGLAGLTNVTGTITSATPGVRVTKAGPRTYGSIAAGGEAGPNFWFQVEVAPDGALCGTEAVLMMNVSSAQGAVVLPFTLPIGTAGANCSVFGSAHAQPASVAIVSDRVNGACGDGDLVADPGETIQVDVQVNNAGDKTANGVVVTLGSDKSYFTVTPAAIDLGSIAANGSETKVATFFVTVGAAPQEDVATLTASVTSNGPTVPATRSITTIVNRDKILKSIAYDFESGAQGWTSSDPLRGWHRTNTAVTTGNLTYVWWSRYAEKRCELLYSPQMEFSPTSSVSFDVAYISENTDGPWDGVNVQVSVDGGRTWITVPAGYDALAVGSGCMAVSEPLFSGVAPTMTRYTADLSSFAGLRGQIRFKFSADDLVDVAVGGAWLDNVTTSDVVVSAPSASCPR